MKLPKWKVNSINKMLNEGLTNEVIMETLNISYYSLWKYGKQKGESYERKSLRSK